MAFVRRVLVMDRVKMGFVNVLRIIMTMDLVNVQKHAIWHQMEKCVLDMVFVNCMAVLLVVYVNWDGAESNVLYHARALKKVLNPVMVTELVFSIILRILLLYHVNVKKDIRVIPVKLNVPVNTIKNVVDTVHVF